MKAIQQNFTLALFVKLHKVILPYVFFVLFCSSRSYSIDSSFEIAFLCSWSFRYHYFI